MAPFSGAEFRGELDGSLGTGDDQLPAAIVVGDLADRSLRSLGAGCLDIGLVETDDRGHGALADRNGGLHGIAANAQEPCGIGDGEHAGCGKRGILAERMAGDIGDLVLQGKALRFQRADRCERNGHQRRLRVGRQRQGFLGPVPHDGGELLAERVVDLLEYGTRRRERHAASSLPIPTPWLPCPGKVNAIAMA